MHDIIADLCFSPAYAKILLIKGVVILYRCWSIDIALHQHPSLPEIAKSALNEQRKIATDELLIRDIRRGIDDPVVYSSYYGSLFFATSAHDNAVLAIQMQQPGSSQHFSSRMSFSLTTIVIAEICVRFFVDDALLAW